MQLLCLLIITANNVVRRQRTLSRLPSDGKSTSILRGGGREKVCCFFLSQPCTLQTVHQRDDRRVAPGGLRRLLQVQQLLPVEGDEGNLEELLSHEVQRLLDLLRGLGQALPVVALLPREVGLLRKCLNGPKILMSKVAALQRVVTTKYKLNRIQRM